MPFNKLLFEYLLINRSKLETKNYWISFSLGKKTCFKKVCFDKKSFKIFGNMQLFKAHIFK